MHKCTCQYDGEDNTLQLVVKEEHYQKFNLKPDGSLEYYDSDADQVIYLECPVCGLIYDFKDAGYDFALQVEERHVATRLDFGGKFREENPIVNLNDYEIEARK